MTTSGKIKLIAVVATIGGPFMAFVGYQDQQRLAALEKDGITVPGYIEGGESRTGRRRGSSYTFDISYVTQGSTAPQKKAFKVTSDFFKSHVSGDSVADPKVDVRYLPSKPEDAIVVGGSTDETVLFPVGIGAFVVGLITSLLMFMRKEAPAS